MKETLGAINALYLTRWVPRSTENPIWACAARIETKRKVRVVTVERYRYASTFMSDLPEGSTEIVVISGLPGNCLTVWLLLKMPGKMRMRIRRQTMREKIWIVTLAVLLIIFVSWPCLAAEEERQEERHEEKAAPEKAGPREERQQPQMHQQQQPQGREQQRTQEKPGGVQRQEPGRPGQAGAFHQISRPVDKAELNRRMSAPVTRQANQRAVSNYRTERARFTRKVPPMRLVPAHRVILKRIRIVPGTYYARRGVFYDTYGYVPPPWIYGLYPRYGLWDTVFLGFMLDRILEPEYAMMYYDHRSDPDMIQWRQQMDQLAMQNADLRAQLAAADQQVAQLQASRAPVDPSYVPPDAQDVALSPDVIDQLTAGK